MKILLAADGSAYTKRMLAYLSEHAEWLEQSHRYTVITVTPALPPRAASALGKDVVKEYHNDEHEKVFKPIRTTLHRAGIEAAYIGKAGHAADIITKVADTGGFDLLMMGSHGSNAFGNLVLGSVTTRVLSQSKVPILIVR